MFQIYIYILLQNYFMGSIGSDHDFGCDLNYFDIVKSGYIVLNGRCYAVGKKYFRTVFI